MHSANWKTKEQHKFSQIVKTLHCEGKDYLLEKQEALNNLLLLMYELDNGKEKDFVLNLISNLNSVSASIQDDVQNIGKQLQVLFNIVVDINWRFYNYKYNSIAKFNYDVLFFNELIQHFLLVLGQIKNGEKIVKMFAKQYKLSQQFISKELTLKDVRTNFSNFDT